MRLGRWALAGALFLGLLVMICVAIGVAAAPADETRVQLEPAELTVLAGDVFTTTLSIRQVVEVGGLSAFDAQITFDPRQVSVESVTYGDFLASTGRVVSELPWRVQPGVADKVSLVLGSFSLGAAPPGPTGDGILATIRWRARRGPVADLQLAGVNLLGIQAQPISAGLAGAQVTIMGTWGRVVFLPIVRR